MAIFHRGKGLALALLAAAFSVHADIEDENGEPETHDEPAARFHLENLVVSATRTERPHFETPAAISVIRRERIESIQPYGYQDLFADIPGVSVQGGPRRIAEEPAIRGFRDEQVAIRVDGTRQNFNQAHRGRFFLDPDLIRTVEILRGASSGIYGSGALGGVFTIETLDGHDLTGGRDGIGARIKLGYQENGDEFASYNTVYGQSGAFDGLASFVYRDLGEDLQDGRGGDILASRDELTNGMLKFGFAPGDFQRIEFSWDGFDNSGRNPPNANDRASATNLVDRDTERDNYRIGYHYDNPANRWLDLHATAWRSDVQVTERRLDDDRLDVSDFDTRGFDVFNTTTLNPPGGHDLRLTYGIEHYRDRQRGVRNGQSRPQFPDARVDYQAAYAQAEIGLPGNLELIPGVRFDAFDYRADGFDDRDDDRLSPRLALGFRPLESLYLWGEYSEAFRAPSLTELFADGVHFVVPLAPGQVVINEFVPTPGLKPEKVEQFQFGGRYSTELPLDRPVRLDAEVVYFHSDIRDYVDQFVIFISGEPAFDPVTGNLVFPGITSNRNVDARIEGVEASLRLSTRHGYLQAAVSTLDSRRTDAPGDLASVQPDQASLTGALHTADRRFSVGARLTAAADRRDVPDEALETAGWGKTDVFVTWLPQHGLLDGLELRLALDNVFDKGYRIHPNAIDQPGRSIRLTIARNFEALQ